MSISDEIARIQLAKNDIKNAIEEKGVSVDDTLTLDGYADKIREIESGEGSSSSYPSQFTGHLDEAGLREIGWTEADIEDFKANGGITWMEEDDEYYKVSEGAKVVYNYNTKQSMVDDRGDEAEFVKTSGANNMGQSLVQSRKPYLNFLPKHYNPDSNYSSFRYIVGAPALCIKNGNYPSTRLQNCFNGCYELRTIPFIDTSTCTDLNSMFSNCRLIRTIPFIDTSNCTTFSYMFQGCTCLITISSLNTSSATAFGSMFSDCTSLEIIPELDMKNATSAPQMFLNCKRLRKVNLKNIGKPSIDLTSMFSGCSSLKDLSNVEISSRLYNRNLSSMFNACSSLEKLPKFTSVNNVDPSNLNRIFYGCNSLKFTMDDIGKFRYDNITTSSYLPFYSSSYCVSSAASKDFESIKAILYSMSESAPRTSTSPCYFYSSSSIQDDADNTLQNLYDSCIAKGWTIYNLTIKH